MRAVCIVVLTASSVDLFGVCDLERVQSVCCGGLDVTHDKSLKALYHYWSQCNGPVFVDTGCFVVFFGSGMMVAFLKQVRIEACVRDKLTISTKISASIDEQVLSVRPRMLFGSAVFRVFLKVLVTSPDETVNGGFLCAPTNQLTPQWLCTEGLNVGIELIMCDVAVSDHAPASSLIVFDIL